MVIAFIKASSQAKQRDDLALKVYERAEQLSEGEQLKTVAADEPSRPWRATDIKTECPRQVYYSRYETGTGTGRQSAAALFGTIVHHMFEDGAEDSESLWNEKWDEEFERLRIDRNSDLIDWQSNAKPFSLSAFRDATPDDRITALFHRYSALDRVNYEEFWRRYPLKVYINEDGLDTIEAVFDTELGSHAIRTTADVIAYDYARGDILPVDWKTGQASEASQLATYAMAAEKVYNLGDGTITRGMFVLTGQGVCLAARGKMPHDYEPDVESSVVEVDNIIEWRPVILERLEKLEKRERTGIWNPKFNALCYRACEYRLRCPVGRALEEVRNDDSQK